MPGSSMTPAQHGGTSAGQEYPVNEAMDTLGAQGKGRKSKEFGWPVVLIGVQSE